MSKSCGGHVHPSSLKLAPCIAELPTYCSFACKHQKVGEDKEVIIKYMIKQEFRIVGRHVQFKRVTEDFQQLSRGRSMQAVA